MSPLLATTFLVVLAIVMAILVVSYVLGVYQQEYRFQPALAIRPDSYILVSGNGLYVYIHVINYANIFARIKSIVVYDYVVPARDLNYTVISGSVWREGPYIVAGAYSQFWLKGFIPGATLPATATSVHVEIHCIACTVVGDVRVKS